MNWFPGKAFLLIGLVAVVALAGSSRSFRDIPLNTWTIVTMDAATGDVGIAGASCVSMTHIDGIAALAPGKGIAVAQGLWSLENRNRVFQILKDGADAGDLVGSARNFRDPNSGQRQYAAVTRRGGKIQISAFTGEDTQSWSGSRQDSGMAVSVQGNLLEGEAVVARALEAFRADGPKERNTIPDRLMRALEAGSAAGGDKRCNNAEVRQTAASAFILFARAKEPAYAARDLGVTDMGKEEAPSLDLSVIMPRYGANPVLELRKEYDAWRKKQ
ncbi:MAG TPA: DUF1028 domain-containing protein [Terriglobia bacterium]|nr:DUF1028 domain-containing protein [Terriglobia bacterium]